MVFGSAALERRPIVEIHRYWFFRRQLGSSIVQEETDDRFRRTV
jgi:hypothetical protein